MKPYGRRQTRKFNIKLQGTSLTHCLNSSRGVLTPHCSHFAAGKSEAGSAGGERGCTDPNPKGRTLTLTLIPPKHSWSPLQEFPGPLGRGSGHQRPERPPPP